MIELPVRHFAGLLPALRALPINHLFARAVLERCVDGRVWVDDAMKPALVHVIHPYGMTLLFGDAAAVAPQTLSRHLNEAARGPNDRWMQVFPVNHGRRVAELLQAEIADASTPPGGLKAQQYTRANFRFEAERFASSDFPRHLPAGMSLRPMSESDFSLPGMSVSPNCFWNDAAQFLRNGGGWCLAQGDEVAAMAFSSFRFDDDLEIGVETRLTFRRRGLAQLAAAKLIETCLAQGLQALWSCRKENRASYRLAQRLGFVPAAEIPYFRLPGRPSSSSNSESS